MPGKPIATITSMHVCPMVTGTVPHVGGPVMGPGAPTVLINGKPAALMGDMCTCAGPPDTIAMGNPLVLINGTPVACMGDMTAHGGVITVGDPTVMIGSATPVASAVMPVKAIPFPKIDFVDRAVAAFSGNGGKLKEAEKKQEEVKKQAEAKEPEPVIYNLQWKKENMIIRDSKVIKQVTLSASVAGDCEGQTVSFKIKTAPPKKAGKEAAHEEVVELSGTVADKRVEVVWEVEDKTKKNSSK